MLQLEVEHDDMQELVDYVEGELSNEDLVELGEQRKLEKLKNESKETTKYERSLLQRT